MSKITAQNLPITNRLLGALPAKEYQLLFPKLELFDLIYTEVIHEPKQTMEYLYFLNSGIVSMNAVEGERTVLEIGMIGKEGAFGLPIFLGDPRAFGRVIVQGAGSAMRIKAADLLDFCELGGALPRLLKLYAYRFVNQITQAMVCNNLHRIEVRLARWLLMMRDRMEDDKFPVTHNAISNMLGVRREAVSKSACNLQRRKLISYQHGNLEIIDAAGLEAVACPCYAVIKEQERELSRSDIRSSATTLKET
jgi:CRP-like cAMP-binding protein